MPLRRGAVQNGSPIAARGEPRSPGRLSPALALPARAGERVRIFGGSLGARNCLSDPGIRRE
jgi:hypothetical protein